jgi:peptide/nickel transport system permease protein
MAAADVPARARRYRIVGGAGARAGLMGWFALRRFAQAIPVLAGVMLLAWALVALAPGDASEIYARQYAESGRPTAEEVARAREALNLDGNIIQQYAAWMGRLLRGDLGRSFATGAPLADELRRRAWPTLQLALAGTAVAVGAGVTLGVVAALNRNRWPDACARLVALASGALPSFFVSLLLIWLFAAKLNMFPSFGRGGIQHLVLPSLALGLAGAGAFTRLVRASMLDVLSQDYVRAARARGLREFRVVTRHALRNALIPACTQLGLTLGALLGGAAIVETIFAWPGLGKLTVDSINARDYPAIQAVVLVSAAVYVLVNACIDISYGYLDPRIRVGARR